MGNDFATREDTAYTNTPEQRASALAVASRFAALDSDLMAKLGLGDTRD